MSMATFWMSLTRVESLSDDTLLEMQRRIDTMISGRLDLSAGGGLIGSLSDRELRKLYREKERTDAEVARRSL